MTVTVPPVKSPSFSTADGPALQRSRGEKVLTTKSVNPAVKAAAYAVRGEIALKADDLQHRLQAGENLGFDHVVNCNIGASLCLCLLG
jgi:hypothetical protein